MSSVADTSSSLDRPSGTRSASDIAAAISDWIAKTPLESTLVRLRPHAEAVRRIDQLGADAQLVPILAHASRQQVLHAQSLADLAQVEIPTLVCERGRTRGDAQIPDPGQRAQDLLGDSVAEIFLVVRRTHVGEGQHGDGWPRIVSRARGHRHTNIRSGPAPASSSEYEPDSQPENDELRRRRAPLAARGALRRLSRTVRPFRPPRGRHRIPRSAGSDPPGASPAHDRPPLRQTPAPWHGACESGSAVRS